MRIAELSLSNWLSLRDKTLAHLGRMQIATGENGVGKTAILKAIEGAFRGAGPETVTVGEDRATILVRLDDATTVRRTISKTASAKGKGTVTVTTADGAKLASPQKYLSTLLGDQCFNPLALFLAEDGKERVRIVTELLDVSVSDEDWKSWGLDDEQVAAINEQGVGLHPLVILAQAEKALVEQRRLANKAVGDAKTGVAAARPPDSELDKAPTVEEAEATVAASRTATETHDAAQGDVTARIEKLAQLRADKTTRERSAADRDDRAAELTGLADTANAVAENAEKAVVSDVQKALALFPPADAERLVALRLEVAELEKADEAAGRVIADIEMGKTNVCTKRDETTELRRQAEAATQDATAERDAAGGLHLQIEALEAEAPAEDFAATTATLRDAERLAAAECNWARVAASIEPKTVEAKRLNEIVGKLRAAPAELLGRSEMPIPGIGIGDDDIMFAPEEKSEPRAGSALCGREQIMLGLQLARAVTPSGIICIDGIEALSEESFAEFVELTKDDGCQYWVTQVTPTGGELCVETIDPDPALDVAAEKAKAATARKNKGKGNGILF